MNMTPEERVAVISTKHGDMVVEFYPDVAPMHVESFIALAEEEYFNGTTFHRVIPGFVIQGGDPNSKLIIELYMELEVGLESFLVLEMKMIQILG